MTVVSRVTDQLIDRTHRRVAATTAPDAAYSPPQNRIDVVYPRAAITAKRWSWSAGALGVVLAVVVIGALFLYQGPSEVSAESSTAGSGSYLDHVMSGLARDASFWIAGLIVVVICLAVWDIFGLVGLELRDGAVREGV